MSKMALIGGTVDVGGHALALATALMCGSLFGVTVEWTPGATSLADGAVTIEYDANAQVTRLVAQPGEESLTLTGTQAVPFAADGELVVSGGVLRVETPVTGAGALKAASADGAISFESMTDYFPSEEAKAIVIARNADLDKYDIAYAWSGGKKATLDYYYGEGDKKSLPYHVVREPGRLSCQIQHVSDVYAKCIFLELKQSGDDIVAWTPKARFADQKYLGGDFREIGSTHMDVSSVANKTWGYGIDACFLGKRRALQDRVEIANVVTLVGSLSVARGLTVRADGAGALSDSAEWATPLALDGVLQFRNPDGLLLSGAITYGIGGVLDVYADAAHAVTPAFTVKVDQAPYENATWLPIASNVDVTAFSSATAYSAGGAFVGSTDWLTFCNLSVAKNAVDFQFQMWDPGGPFIKGVVYRLRQNGLVVEGRTIATGYKASAVQSDLGNVDITKYNRNAVKYGMKDVTLNFAEKPGLWCLKLGGAAKTADGRIEVRGVPDGRVIVEVVKENADGLSIDVGDDAVFMHNASGGAYGSGRDGLTVSGSGEFWDNGTWGHSGEKGWIVLDGGMFKVSANGAGLADDVQGLYLNFVRLMNGGRMTSKIPRSGYYANPTWEVRGTSPSYIDNGLGIVGHGTNARVTTFDVADVTGTADPDLYIDGKLYYSNTEWKNASLRKTGAGTVRTTAKDTVTSKPLQLQGGTWLLAASGLMTSANNVSFEGGALGVADGCTIALGAVTHGADVAAPISLGENAQLSISSFTPAKTGKLEVSAPASARLRIGTSACLTGTQRRHIRLNGKAVHQDSDGYVLEGGYGFLMVFR